MKKTAKNLLLIFMAVTLLLTSACTSAVVLDEQQNEQEIVEKIDPPEEPVPEEVKPEEAEKPEEKPQENKPEKKPEQKPATTPEVKPQEPEVKPEEKPVVMPEEKPEEKPAAPSQSLTGTLPEIIDKIYEKQTVGEIMLGTITQDMMDFTDAEVLNMYTGISDTSAVKEVAVSEAMIGSIPYSLALVRVNDESKASEVAQNMYDNINTRKWICVVADDLKVAVYGDVVMLIMVGTDYADTVTAQQIVDAFKDVCGGSLTKVIG